MAAVLGGLGLVHATGPTAAQSLPDCTRTADATVLGDRVDEYACVRLGPRDLLVAVVPELGAENQVVWAVRVAVVRNGVVRTRAKVLLDALHPDGHVPDRIESARLGIVRAGALVRIGVGMTSGEDVLYVEELAWLVDLDGDRVRSYGSGIGDLVYSQSEDCSLVDSAAITATRDRARLRFVRTKRFVPERKWSRAERAARQARCRFDGGPRAPQTVFLHPRALPDAAAWPPVGEE